MYVLTFFVCPFPAALCTPNSIHRRYAKNVSSLGGGIKSRIMGNEDFAMSDLLTSTYDLQYASRNFKFGLIPKVLSVACIGGLLVMWTVMCGVAVMPALCNLDSRLSPYGL